MDTTFWILNFLIAFFVGLAIREIVIIGRIFFELQKYEEVLDDAQ